MLLGITQKVIKNTLLARQLGQKRLFLSATNNTRSFAPMNKPNFPHPIRRQFEAEITSSSFDKATKRQARLSAKWFVDHSGKLICQWR